MASSLRKQMWSVSKITYSYVYGSKDTCEQEARFFLIECFFQWSYGVTCWEVFSLGRTPYPGVDPFTLIKHLEGGGRLDKPSNAACSDDV